MWMHRPTGYNDLDLLGLSANYRITWDRHPRPVLFFQEHRMAVPAVFAALKDELFSQKKPL